MNKLALWVWAAILIIFFVGWDILYFFGAGVLIGLIVMFVKPELFDKL